MFSRTLSSTGVYQIAAANQNAAAGGWLVTFAGQTVGGTSWTGSAVLKVNYGPPLSPMVSGSLTSVAYYSPTTGAVTSAGTAITSDSSVQVIVFGNDLWVDYTGANGTGAVSVSVQPAGLLVGAADPIPGALPADNPIFSGSLTSDTVSATAIAVGKLATAPAFAVDASTGSQAAGLKVTGATAAGTVAIASVSSGAAAGLSIDAKGTGAIGIGATSTGAVTITPATNVVGNLTVVTDKFSVTAATGATAVKSAATQALAVGLTGATNPAFQVDASTASQVAGLKVTGAATGGTVALVATDSGAAANVTINALGVGTIGIGTVSTGVVTITPATTITGIATVGTTGGVVQNQGGAAAAATTASTLLKVVTGITDNSATTVLTITVPNAAHAANVQVTLVGSAGASGAIGAFEDTTSVTYNIAVTRTPGVAMGATVSAAFGSAAAVVAGAGTMTCVGAITLTGEGVGATNTAVFKATIDQSSTSTLHRCIVYATIVNANATGITIS